MEYQHHLIQQNEHERPLVPALTVIGFAQYYVSCILANPDTEFDRLEKIVADMPSIVVAGSLNDAKEGVSPPEILPKAIRRDQLPSRADAKSKQLVDGAFEDLMYELELQPPPPKKEPPSRHPQTDTTTTATITTKIPAPVSVPEPKTAAAEKPVSFSFVLGPSRSASRPKYALPSPLPPIGDDDHDDASKADGKIDSSLDHGESEWRRRERDLERASMPGPRQGHARLHSWHAEPTGTDGSTAHHNHQPTNQQQQQRYGGRASQQSYTNVPAAQSDIPQSQNCRAPAPSAFPPPSPTASSAMGRAAPTSAASVSPPGGGGGPASSPATSVTHQWNPLQYRPATLAEPSRPSSIAGGAERLEQQKPHHVRWEGVQPQQKGAAATGREQPLLATPAAVTSRAATIGSQSSIKTERRPSQRHHHGRHHYHHHHRRFPSSGGSSAAVGDDDDNDNDNRKGETWEEFLRAQKKGEGYHSR
ncbi:hypothetical protein PG994_001992 [Apiospora phragmitis]|uniref:DUF7514 domain-containing protein n=1 Tax=Apiospora phragmitis TaxID=2905665 RepID=A0ABR1WV33_9PEZI